MKLERIKYLCKKILGLNKLFVYRLLGRKVGFDKTVYFDPSSKIIFGSNDSKIILGKHTKIDSHVEIKLDIQGNMIIGDNVNISPYSYFEVGYNATLEIGHEAFFNRLTNIICMDHIKIGNHVALGRNISFYDHDHVVKVNIKQNWEQLKKKPIEIGNDVWIGANAIILRGTKVGNNAVIAAGTIVKEDIPANIMYYCQRKKFYRKIINEIED
jgi:acetyltransferase-like isoleucine patch superfamily enzyme